MEETLAEINVHVTTSMDRAKLIKEHAKQKPPRQMKRGLLQYVKKKSWER